MNNKSNKNNLNDFNFNNNINNNNINENITKYILYYDNKYIYVVITSYDTYYELNFSIIKKKKKKFIYVNNY